MGFHYNPVSLVKYEEEGNSLRRAIELCNGFDRLKESDRVLLKPNMVWGGGATSKVPKFGLITTSRILEDIIQLLREYGCRNITIGEGTVADKELGNTTLRGYKWAGIEKVAKKYGVQLIDFHSEPHITVPLDGTTIDISKSVLETDFLINVPVLKTHSMTKVSLSLKNLKGCISMSSRKTFHRKPLDRMIALLNEQVKPNLTIIDGIYGLESGPTAFGTAHRMNIIIAGIDSLACDIVGATVLGIEPSSVEHLKKFASITNRPLDITTIDVRGERIADVSRKLDWNIHYEDFFDDAGIRGVTFQFPGKRFCTGCVTHTDSILAAFCKDNKGMSFDNVEICAGAEVTPKRESKKVFLMGNCSIKANRDIQDTIRVKGCPPKAADMLISLTTHTLDKRKAAKIIIERIVKSVAYKLGVYNEQFPVFSRYNSPEFDERHFVN